MLGGMKDSGGATGSKRSATRGAARTAIVVLGLAAAFFVWQWRALEPARSAAHPARGAPQPLDGRQPAKVAEVPPPADSAPDAPRPLAPDDTLDRSPWQREDAAEVRREIAAAGPRDLDVFRTVSEPRLLEQYRPGLREGVPVARHFDGWHPGRAAGKTAQSAAP